MSILAIRQAWYQKNGAANHWAENFCGKDILSNQEFASHQNAFREAFSDKEPPAKKTIWTNFEKYETREINLNRNRRHLGQRRTARYAENIEQ